MKKVLGLLHPVLWLHVGGVINFLGRVDGGLDVVQEGSTSRLGVVDQDAKGVVSLDDECVHVRNEVVLDRRGVCGMLLLNDTLGALVAKDEVNLRGSRKQQKEKQNRQRS